VKGQRLDSSQSNNEKRWLESFVGDQGEISAAFVLVPMLEISSEARSVPKVISRGECCPVTWKDKDPQA
jgi:hypothetical protein